MKSFKYLFYCLFSIFVFNSCSVILNFQDLPNPKGEYIIGTDLFDWEDKFRDEWFTKDKIDTRKITVQIWYPASEKSDSLYPYMDFPEIRVKSISKRINQPKGLVKPISTVKGNSYYKAPPIDEKFPLLLFSHGFGGYKTQNSIAIEALVSQGYVVASVDHTHDANITIFQDGNIINYNSEVLDNVPDNKFWDIRLPQVNTRSDKKLSHLSNV